MTARPDLPGATASAVAVEGVRFHLYRAGPKRKRKTTPTLLLHGVPETAAMWAALVPELATDRVVLAPDLKGLGDSEAQGPYDLATLAAEMAALVLHEVDGPVDIVGHDWGGAIGLALAASRPELVRRLVVVSAPYREIDPLRSWYMGVAALPLLPEVGFRLLGNQFVRTAFRTLWRAPQPPEFLEHYVAAYADPHRYEAMLSYYRDNIRQRLSRAALTAVGVEPRRKGAPRARPSRALVMVGAEDSIITVPIAEGVVRDLGASASLVTLPGVGHFPVEEAPDVAVATIADFLRAP